MHECGLINNLFKQIEEQYPEEDLSRISKVMVKVSLFGGIEKEHLREHFDTFIKDTPWKNVSLRVKNVECGAPLALDKVEFIQN